MMWWSMLEGVVIYSLNGLVICYESWGDILWKVWWSIEEDVVIYSFGGFLICYGCISLERGEVHPFNCIFKWLGLLCLMPTDYLNDGHLPMVGFKEKQLIAKFLSWTKKN